MSIQGLFPLGLTGLISLQSKGLSEVFSTQFEGITSSALCLLYGPVLTTVCDHWEDHSLDYAELCWQSNVSDIALNVILKITLNRYFLRLLEAGNLR